MPPSGTAAKSVRSCRVSAVVPERGRSYGVAAALMLTKK